MTLTNEKGSALVIGYALFQPVITAVSQVRVHRLQTLMVSC